MNLKEAKKKAKQLYKIDTSFICKCGNILIWNPYYDDCYCDKCKLRYYIP